MAVESVEFVQVAVRLKMLVSEVVLLDFES